MRKTSAIGTTAALILASLALISGCGSDSADAGQEEAAAGGFDRCTLLTDEEVEQIVGPHDGGKRHMDNTWGLGSCRWKATTAQVMEGWPDGWFDTIEVALFDEDMVETWARGEAEGERVDGLVDGAVYDSTGGQLWFECAGDRFCVVSVRTASSDQRAETAMRFAGLVTSRLQ